MTGKDIRLRQLFKHSKRLFVLPMDHGITIGPVEGIRDIGEVISVVKNQIDAIVLHKGMVSQATEFINPYGCSLIVHLSASTTLAPDPNLKELVSTVEHAIKLGATAVSVHVNLGSKAEAKMLRDFGMIAETCESWGLPLLAMMYVRDGVKESEYNLDKIKHSVRVAEELGADIVKINYTGSVESFSEVTGSVKIPVIIAGGPRMSSDYELLKLVNDSIKAGASGVAFGRNVFQHPSPAPLACAIRKIMDNEVAEEDIKVLADVCNGIIIR